MLPNFKMALARVRFEDFTDLKGRHRGGAGFRNQTTHIRAEALLCLERPWMGWAKFAPGTACRVGQHL
jgi:hypothetical protein